MKIEAMQKVCNEIVAIMETYREQEASPLGVGTPGGLEHMGDVWRLLAKWERELKAMSVSLNGGLKK